MSKLTRFSPVSGPVALVCSVALALACGGGDEGSGGGGSGSGNSTAGTGNGSSGSTGNGGTSSAGTQGQGGNLPLAGSGGEGPQGGAGGASGGQGNAGDGGSGGVSGGAGGGGNPNAGCSDAVLRTEPPAGKEALKAAPIDNKFPFSSHWMATFSANPSAVGITGMADFDNDGDLDFAAGQRGGEEQWYEYCSPDHWVQHTVGTGHNSPGGGNALDVDQDGFVDIIAGDSWYKNPGNPRESEWQRYSIGIAGAEDVAVGDVSGDGKPDALWVINSIDPEWRTPGADPTMPWPTGDAMTNRQQQGGFIGDIDGDGDNDILVGNRWWYRNLNGMGTMWEDVEISMEFDDSPLTTIGDLDGDGDMDLAMCTHFGNRAAWVRNLDGDGTQWEVNILAADKNKLHSIFALDFDNDGDLDVLSVESSGNAYIWENVDGNGPTTEHTIASTARGHDARVGDVDCDGDLDIAGKPWGEGDPEPRDTIYLKNETVENGGTAVFQRPAGEVWNPVQQRMYCGLVLE